MMKKSGWSLLLLIFLLLTGCARESNGSEEWTQALDRLKRKENYTVTETEICGSRQTERISRYTRSKSCLDNGEEIIYYSKEKNTCFAYVFNDDSKIWVRDEITNSGLYFFDYANLERLNKISSYLDMGLLTWNPESGTLIGENLTSSYVFRGEVHAPQRLEITIIDGEIYSIQETWMGYADDDDTVLCEKQGEVIFSDFSTTEFSLPLDVVDLSEIEEAQEVNSSNKSDPEDLPKEPQA